MPNEEGTLVYTLQKNFQRVFGFTLPLFHGRGLLNCTIFPSPSLVPFDYVSLNHGIHR